jgi:hypothetical protein
MENDLEAAVFTRAPRGRENDFPRLPGLGLPDWLLGSTGGGATPKIDALSSAEPPMKTKLILIVLLMACLPAAPALRAAERTRPDPGPSPWADWVAPDFPFFSSVLDARRAGPGAHNVTPRGLVLNLGHERSSSRL